MTDILIKRLPRYVNQFQPTVFAETPSKYRCASASAAMCLDFAYPNKFDPWKVEHDLYSKYDGADVASNYMGMTKAEIEAFFKEMNVGYIDMDDLVQEGLRGNIQPLYDEIEAQNRQGVIQFITVGDESFLRDAQNGEKLHNWVDTGLSHCIVRVGFSDDEGYGFYMEPAAPGFHQPVPISWSKAIVPGKIITALAIMPPDVPTPPAGFRFSQGVWPKPKPAAPDFSKIAATAQAMSIAAENATKASQQAAEANAALQAAIAALTSDLVQLKSEE